MRIFKKNIPFEVASIMSRLNLICNVSYDFTAEYSNFLSADSFTSLAKLRDELIAENATDKLLKNKFTALYDAVKELYGIADSYEILCENCIKLSELEVKLRKEIENYSTAIEEIRTKNRLSADWNGKKQPLITLGEQLRQKRSDFLRQEELLDGQIAKFHSKYKEYSANLSKLILEFSQKKKGR